MSSHSHKKAFYHRSSRHAGEAYWPALADDEQTLAYLQVSAEHETLMLQRRHDVPALALCRPGFLFSPCFAGEWLTWVERMDDRWAIRGTRWRDDDPAPRTLSVSEARPLHLVSAVAGDRVWLAWEERLGRATRLRLARLDDAGITADPLCFGPAGVNAYDPALAVAVDGSLYCAFCAYAWDSYRILLVRFTPDGAVCGEPLPVSHSASPCVWPSLWAAARGGVWWSFTCYAAPISARMEHVESTAYVRHERYRRQREFFGCRGVVYAGWCDGAGHWVTMGKPEPHPLPFHVATGLVFGTEGAGHSQIIEDSAQGLHLLLRHYAPVEREAFRDQTDPPLRVHPDFRPMQPERMHPNLALFSLNAGVWTAPVVLVPRAHFDLPIVPRFDGRRLAVAFAEDRRRTGWSGQGEWFDDVGEIGLGALLVELSPVPTEHDLHPLATTPIPSGAMTNPRPDGEMAPGNDGRRYALGQTHCHTTLSVCQRELDRDPHFNYRFMQDVQHCRFGALTDHEYNLWHTEMLLVRKLAEYYYFPGEFVALPAYEWTGSEPLDCSHDGGPFGHVNVLGFEPLTTSDFHNPNDASSPGNSLPKLWRCIAGRPIMTPPHHAMDYAHYYRWEFWNDEFEPVIELFQDDRGSSESGDAPGVTNGTRACNAIWAVEQLRGGRKFGFIAGGDHRGIALAGLWTRELTREALYEAMRARASYGTTGLCCGVWFACNGRFMGSDQAGIPASFELCVRSVVPVVRVEVLRNGAHHRSLPGVPDPTQLQRWEWTEDSASSGDFWYCRIHWPDGELAWTSPIWC